MSASLTKGARRGVTLPEVLVAAGVVVALVGVSIPAVGRVRGEARSTECLSHLRQLSVAARTYAEIYRERLPPAVVYLARPGGVVTHCWDFRHRPGGVVEPGALRGLTDRPELVQQCPCCEVSSTFGNDPATGYNYNTSFLGTEGRMPIVAPDGTILDGWRNARLGIPPARHRHPERAALLGDGGWRSGANKFMRAPSNSIENDWGMVYAGGQAFRHDGRTNVAWLDGHCSSVATPHGGPLGEGPLAANILGFPANGFLSEDDSAYDPR